MKIFRFMILFIAVFLMVESAIADTTTPLPTPVGKVVWVKGTFKAEMPNKEQRILQKESIIYLHDTLTTDTQTQAQIVFTDNSLMTFRPNTQFYIDKYQYNPKAKGGSVGSYVMKLIEGGFRTITGIIAKSNPSDYQVNTPVATIGVRGTDYAVYIHQNQLYVGYYAGMPCVHGMQGGTVCLDDKTRYAYVPSAGVNPVPLNEQPAVFKEKLVVTPITMSPFPSNTGPGSVTSKGGTVTSFCIQ